jgi:hypothetical protein
MQNYCVTGLVRCLASILINSNGGVYPAAMPGGRLKPALQGIMQGFLVGRDLSRRDVQRPALLCHVGA